MSNHCHCVKCGEVWKWDDFVCPCCGSCAIDQESRLQETLKYKFFKSKYGNHSYDVIRISTGKSVSEEPENYRNKDGGIKNV